MTENMYPIDRDAESITFIACRPTHVDGHTGDLQASTWYQARVIARGSYVGEPAVLQSMEAPSVAAVSTYDTITVR